MPKLLGLNPNSELSKACLCSRDGKTKGKGKASLNASERRVWGGKLLERSVPRGVSQVVPRRGQFLVPKQLCFTIDWACCIAERRLKGSIEEQAELLFSSWDELVLQRPVNGNTA